MKIFFGAAAFLAVAAAFVQGAPLSEFIFDKAPFPSSHASTVVELRNGNIMAAWFGGTAEDNPDVGIWASVRSKAGWSTPVEMAKEPDIAAYNPVLFYTKNHRLWLYYKFGPHPKAWTGARRWSDDDGKTWSAVEHLPAGLYGPIRAKPLVLPDGVVISGTSVESYGSWACWIERSTDDGKTFSRIGPISVPGMTQNNTSRSLGIIQPTVIPLSGKHLRLYARSTGQIGHICAADSYDNGSTWSQAHPLELPNPNAGIDAVALHDDRIVLVYNDTPKGRTPLNLAISHDGEHFQMFHTLESEPGEFSYPDMVVAHNGDLLITYTWKREKIKFVRFPAAEIPKP